MAYLDKGGLLRLTLPDATDHEIRPGAKVRLRPLPGSIILALPGDVESIGERAPLLVAESIVDENGETFFTEEEAARVIDALTGAEILGLLEAIGNVSGVGNTPLEDAQGE